MRVRLWPAILGPLSALALQASAAEEGIQPLLREPVPLVLKDGRIAVVSVYAIPFSAESAVPAPGVAEDLRRLLASHATDCFLTAQAIGHVAPGAEREGETLAAHRLARARADSIQDMLRGFGLAPRSIASVWDWQFVVPESRVTLWIFELSPGEDCGGRPLAAEGKGSPAPSAATEPPAGEQSRPVEASAQTAPPREAGPEEAEELGNGAAEPEREKELVRFAASEEPPPLIRSSADAAEENGAVSAAGKQPQEAPEHAEAPSGEDGSATAAPAAARGEQAADAETQGEVATRAEDSSEVAIVFAVNSSYPDPEARRALAAFVDTLGPGPHRFEIAAAVAEGGVKNARSPEEAKRYNLWIAKRRLARVRHFLEKRLQGRIAAIEERFIEGDSSRRVILRARPAVAADPSG